MNVNIEAQDLLRNLLAEFADEPANNRQGRTGEWSTIGEIAHELAATIGRTCPPRYREYIDFLMWGSPTVLWPDGTAFEGMGFLHPADLGPLDLVTAFILFDGHEQERLREPVSSLASGVRAFEAMRAWKALFDAAIQRGHLAPGANPADRLSQFLRCTS